MATYYGTYGQKVQYLASDPSDPQTGQVWYNSTSATLKVRSVTTSGTYSSGGNMNTGRKNLGGVGSQTAALGFGGYEIPNYLSASESYDGTSWTNTPSLSSARGLAASAGTQTSALYAGGFAGGPHPNPVAAITEEWNGSSWGSGGNLGTGRQWLAGSGTQTAGIAFGGGTPVVGYTTGYTEEYDGTSWTAGGNLNTARSEPGRAGNGTQTATLAFGGFELPPGNTTAVTESYNGTSWTSVNSLNTLRSFYGSGGGTQTTALAMAGGNSTGNVNATEDWNGTSWTTNGASLNILRNSMAGAGTQTSALIFGGAAPGNVTQTSTEEYSGAGVAVTRTVTVS